MEYRYIRVEEDGDELVVYFLNRDLVADMAIEGVARELYGVAGLAGTPTSNVVLDFSGVQVVSSSLLGKLITLNKRLGAVGSSFRIRNLTPAVTDMFRLIGLFGIASNPPKARRGDLLQTVEDVAQTLRSRGLLFGSITRVPELHGIEVSGIRHERDAHAILQVLGRMFPSWFQEPARFKRVPDWGWQVAIHRDLDPRTDR